MFIYIGPSGADKRGGGASVFGVYHPFLSQFLGTFLCELLGTLV